MRKIFNIEFLIILIACPIALSGQEIYGGLRGNPVAEEYYSKNPVSKKASIPSDTIELPFIDDFSDSFVEPKQKLWSDRYAFINSTFAIFPPSVGVATLDALNYDGSQYPNANILPYQADFLTSQPINLNFLPSDSIYLSFYIQPGGVPSLIPKVGVAPEESDSLILDFFNPESLEWKKVWSSPGIDPNDVTNRTKEFERTLLKIDDTTFLKKGFKFRFRNYASQNSTHPDRRGNTDFWNIDYIKLDKNRTFSDTILRDVAFIEPVKSILKDYSSIPWSHFEAAYNTQRAPFIEVIINNHDSISRNIGTVLEMRGLLTQNTIYKPQALNNNIASGDSILYKYSYNYPFDFTAGDSAAFEIKTTLQTDLFDYKPNDTLRFTQKFYDYYALDDGTAEAGYGIGGDNTKDVSSAIKYNTFAPDSLRAIDIYFVQLMDSANLNYYFYLKVWADNAGKPGKTLVSQMGMRPEYSDNINKFVRYRLDSAVFIPGAFYIGFKNTLELNLGVGLDMNRNNPSRIFNTYYNGIWQSNPKFAGTPMMRPVFRSYAFFADNIVSTAGPEISAWPNPADTYINFSTVESFKPSTNSRIELIDISGRTIRSVNPNDETIINTADLQNGMYFLRMNDPASKKSRIKKIIISH
jgi:hypothetical protein